MTTTATENQINFIKSLSEQRVLTEGEVTALGMVLDERGIDKREASKIIDWLKGLPKAEAPARSFAEVPEGMHRVGQSIFKVQRAVHGSGNLYAKRLTAISHPTSADARCYCSELQGVQCGVCRSPEDTEWSFEYAPGAMKFLSEETKMTLEEAKEFGLTYGACCRCGRTLTDEQSIADGIGPICREKF